jgi:hypothetical protein
LNHIAAGHVSHAGEGNGRCTEAKPFKIGLIYSGRELVGTDSDGVDFVVLGWDIAVLLVRKSVILQSHGRT